MTEYLVEWSIDIEADSPRQAALKAQALQQTNREDYWAGVFLVRETTRTYEVDLDAKEDMDDYNEDDEDDE